MPATSISESATLGGYQKAGQPKGGAERTATPDRSAVGPRLSRGIRSHADEPPIASWEPRCQAWVGHSPEAGSVGCSCRFPDSRHATSTSEWLCLHLRHRKASRWVGCWFPVLRRVENWQLRPLDTRFVRRMVGFISWSSCLDPMRPDFGPLVKAAQAHAIGVDDPSFGVGEAMFDDCAALPDPPQRTPAWKRRDDVRLSVA